MMIGNAINAKGAALELRDLSSEALETVSGGWFRIPFFFAAPADEGVCRNDPCAQFQQIMQQLTQG